MRFDGDSFRIYKAMPLDEHYFGLGDKTGPLDRRNEAFTLWNTDAYRFQESTDPLYKSIPYFMTFRAGRAMGVLLDNTWRTSFDFGKESPDSIPSAPSAGPVDYYLFYGPAPKQVVETYAWLTGTPPLPPLWSLGYQQSRYSYMTQARVLEVADRLRAIDSGRCDLSRHRLPGKNRPFTVNRVRPFPIFRHDRKPEGGKLPRRCDHRSAHRQVQVRTTSHMTAGWPGDHFVRIPMALSSRGTVWPGPSVFPDFTRQQTRAWWGTLYREFHRDGAEGFWNDMNEPSIFDSPTSTMPLNVVHRIDEPGFAPRTATHAEIHDVYGMENSRATFDGLRALDPDTRPFVLTGPPTPEASGMPPPGPETTAAAGTISA